MEEVVENTEPIEDSLYLAIFKSGPSDKEVAWGEGLKKAPKRIEPSYNAINDQDIPF